MRETSKISIPHEPLSLVGARKETALSMSLVKAYQTGFEAWDVVLRQVRRLLCMCLHEICHTINTYRALITNCLIENKATLFTAYKVHVV